MASLDSLYGRGWAFPPAFTLSEGAILAADYIEDIQQSLRILFNTLPLERLVHSWYGCDLHALMFENVNADLLTQLRQTIGQSMADYEPRVSLITVEAMLDDVSLLGGGQEGFNVLRIQVSYTIRGTGQVFMEEGVMDISNGQGGYFV